MKSNNPCITSTIADALERLPGPEVQRFATVFQHGSWLVEIYAPRGTDPQQPHTRDEIYFVAAGTGEYVCGDHESLLYQPIFFSLPPAPCIASKTSRAI